MDFLKDLEPEENINVNPFSAFFLEDTEDKEPTLDEVIEQVIEESPKPKTEDEKEETVITVEEQFETELQQELSENKELQKKIEEDQNKDDSISEETGEEPVQEVEPDKEEEKTVTEKTVTPEQTSEEKPKKRGRRKKAKKEENAEDKDPEESSDETFEFEDIQGGKVATLDEATSILNIEANEDFEKFRKEITEKVNNIYITSDINPTSVGIAVEAIDSLMVDVMEWYWRTKTIYDNLTNDKDGKLTVVRSLNKKGANPDERARNSYLALKNYKLKDNTTIDLLDTVYSIRYQYTFISNVFDRLKMKKDLLVTMTAKLKMEQ